MWSESNHAMKAGLEAKCCSRTFLFLWTTLSAFSCWTKSCARAITTGSKFCVREDGERLYAIKACVLESEECSGACGV